MRDENEATQLVLKQNQASNHISLKSDDMKKASTPQSDQDIPELKREQLGMGVQGKYLKNNNGIMSNGEM